MLKDAMFSSPPVFAAAADAAELTAVASTAGTSSFGAKLFLKEFERMAVCTDPRHPRFVRLDDTVTYRDLRTKVERRVRVVRPDRAEAEENRISVLAPIGAALIGLSEGAIFRWTEPDGRLRAIKVLDIEPSRDVPASEVRP
jgi:regulator of nucleoside diphosphate kinase